MHAKLKTQPLNYIPDYLFTFVCVCVSCGRRGGVCGGVHAHVCRYERGVFLCHKKNLSLNWEFDKWASMSGQQTPRTILSLPPQRWHYPATPGPIQLFIQVLRIQTQILVYVANNLPTEPFPWPILLPLIWNRVSQSCPGLLWTLSTVTWAFNLQTSAL